MSEKNEKNAETTGKCKISADIIDKDTRLTDLSACYPKLKNELPDINEKFKMLKMPLARIMLPKATVAVMS